MDKQESIKKPYSHILGYSMGNGATSLTMNSISAFSLLFYTQALGLPFDQAGLAFAISALWDAFIDPFMGHLSDNTKSRWGRRHPYILLGGLMMAVTFYFIWMVPDFIVTASPHAKQVASSCFQNPLFIYLLAINILFRTGFAIFSVPYGALGMEVCTDYHQRSLLAGTGSALNMLANLLGPALGWMIFFPDHKTEAGAVATEKAVEATSIVSNYHHMGTSFAIATAVFTILVVWMTKHYIVDTRKMLTGAGNSFKAFLKDSKQVFTDRALIPVMLFNCIGTTGAIFVATIQMYLYVYFMHLTAMEKTIIHGGGMILCGSGALFGTTLGRKFDKKYAACIGAMIAATFDLIGGTVFLTGLLKPGDIWTIAGLKIPISVIVFGGCDMINWFGVGIFMTLASSMIADISEVNDYHTGIRKDGSYAAITAFISKLVGSVVGYIATACLAWVGFVEGSDTQTPQSLWWLVLLTFGIGSFFIYLVIPFALSYPITQDYIDKVKKALAERRTKASAPEQALEPEPAVD